MSDYAIYILTRGRPHRQYTLNMLRDGNVQRPIYLVCDDTDPELPTYKRLYGDAVVVFSVRDYMDRVDIMDTMHHRSPIPGLAYARNACYDIASSMGYDYFLQLDDDYYAVYAKQMMAHGVVVPLTDRRVCDVGRLFDVIMDAYVQMPQVHVLALGQSGDLPGVHNYNGSRMYMVRRKAMNTLFLSPKRRVWFRGRMNEDTTLYTAEQRAGRAICMTLYLAVIKQIHTQQQPGGVTELYKMASTYAKTMYSVVAAPSCVQVHYYAYMTDVGRVHHRVDLNACAPKILRPNAQRSRESAHHQ